MKPVPTGFLLFVIVLAGGVLSDVWSAETKSEIAPAWEYRVLTKEQVIDRGKKDLGAGLNQLGSEGWELAAIDAVYIFKRARGRNPRETEELKSIVAVLESDVEFLQDRVTWGERMVRKGYRTEQQLRYDRGALMRTEAALERARRELLTLPVDPKEATGKERKPRREELLTLPVDPKEATGKERKPEK
jgi:hypothetical protein